MQPAAPAAGGGERAFDREELAIVRAHAGVVLRQLVRLGRCARELGKAPSKQVGGRTAAGPGQCLVGKRDAAALVGGEYVVRVVVDHRAQQVFLMLEGGLRLLALGDVQGDRGDVDDGVLRAPQRALVGQQDTFFTTAVAHRLLVRRRALAALDDAPLEFDGGPPQRLAIDLHRRLAHNLVRVEAEEIRRVAVGEDVTAMDVGGGDQRWHRVDHLQQLFAAAPQLLGVRAVAAAQTLLQQGRTGGEHLLLLAQSEQVACPHLELAMIDGAEQEVGGARLEGAVAELPVFVDRDHDHGNIAT